ncbi:MAG: hypothetical protein AAF982_07900 [Pseudomonadota bacterium]
MIRTRPWRHGANENTGGLAWQDFPKGAGNRDFNAGVETFSETIKAQFV